MGHWCPLNSELPHANPCPTGKYNNNTGQDAAAELNITNKSIHNENTFLAKTQF
jgi:hypothetical protein